jgi:hypothetical protein
MENVKLDCNNLEAMSTKNIKNRPDNASDDDVQRQIRLIHRLAVRLPCIVVFFVILTVVITLIEIIFFR